MTAHNADDAKLLRSSLFRREREDGWRRLEALVDRVEKEGVRSLSPAEAQELPLLYRSALSSLSVARSIALDRNLLRYLESLSLRAYLAVYGPRSSLAGRAAAFLRSGFPASVRRLRRHLALATVFLLAGVFAGFVLVRQDPAYYTAIIPAELAGNRLPGASAETLRASIFAPWPGYVETFVVFANSLFRHNTQVGILSFGLGFALGLPTMGLLAYNGMILGAIAALHAEQGLAVDFIGWLAIHGVTELLAILLCGAAGFALAESVVFPGRLSRLENLARNGRLAAGVAAGSVVLFFIAGILEGGFRQLVNDTAARYAFAAMTAAVWILYFSKAGKGEDGRDDV